MEEEIQMHKNMIVLLAVIALGYGGAAVSRVGGHDGPHGNAGGMTSGQMSQEGRDNTNAQWSGGATSGQGRSDLRSGDNQGHGQNHGKGHGQGHGGGHGKHGKGGAGGGAH